jgi:flagellar hook-basal body complex protein FliE
MNTPGIDQLLQELNSLSARAAGQDNAAPVGNTDFGQALKTALDQVNGAQQDAAKATEKFDLNAPDANLHEVMLSLQKASLSFQTMVQVRNRLVSAYQEIMNMSV